VFLILAKKSSKDTIKVGTKGGSISATGKAAIIIAFAIAFSMIIFVYLYFR